MVGGQLTNFKVVISAAPGTNQAWVFHINRALAASSGSGTSQASCTIGTGQTSCTIAGPVTFNDADRLSIRAIRTGSAPQVRVAFKADYAFN
jgi:hypothetical protein